MNHPWFTSRFTFEVNQHVNRIHAVLNGIKEKSPKIY